MAGETVLSGGHNKRICLRCFFKSIGNDTASDRSEFSDSTYCECRFAYSCEPWLVFITANPTLAMAATHSGVVSFDFITEGAVGPGLPGPPPICPTSQGSHENTRGKRRR